MRGKPMTSAEPATPIAEYIEILDRGVADIAAASAVYEFYFERDQSGEWCLVRRAAGTHD